MAKKNEQLGNKKIDSLQVGVTYKVNYSCLRKVNSTRGDFMSASFIIENADGNKCWVSTPNERSAYKAIGVMTGTRINGNRTTITGLRVIKNGKYLEFEYDLSEYIPEINEDEFEDITEQENEPPF